MGFVPISYVVALVAWTLPPALQSIERVLHPEEPIVRTIGVQRGEAKTCYYHCGTMKGVIVFGGNHFIVDIHAQEPSHNGKTYVERLLRSVLDGVGAGDIRRKRAKCSRTP
jgi:hypothetical protein